MKQMEEQKNISEEALAEMRAAIKLNSELYYAVFATESGEKLIGQLENMTMNLSSLNTNEMMDINAQLEPRDMMNMREGQDQVIRYIKNMVKFYKDNR